MARTRRSRQAAAAPAASVPDSDTEQQQAAPSRGRTRTSRAAAPPQRQASVDHTPSAGSFRAPASSVRHTSVDSVEIGRRAAGVLETPSLRRDTTGLDMNDSIFGDLGDSFADGEVSGAEPRSASTTRSWSTFKPRSRASSVVGRTDAPIRPSSRGGGAHNSNTSVLTSSFNIGAFRRRAREPSILGTTRRAAAVTTATTTTGPRSETSGRGAQSDLESEGEGGEGFAPDAESTPLHVGRRTRASLAASSRSRDVSANVSAARTTRKRKSEAAEEEEEEGRAAKTTRTEEQTDSDSEMSELSSPPLPPSTPLRQRAMTPVNLDEINAPPASSGSEDEGDVWPDIHALAKRRRRLSVTTPLRAAGGGEDNAILSDVSSPPSLTHSPNYDRGRAPLRAHQPKPLTTADLANLLPKRRYNKRRQDAGSDEEGREEDDEDDEQEEAEEEEVPVTRTRGGRIVRPPSRGASATGHTPARGTRSASQKHKTYGRRSSDKENQDDDEVEDDEDNSHFQPLADDTFADTTATAALPDFQSMDELRRATTKFSEVDKWQLDYEEVTASLSPQGAR